MGKVTNISEVKISELVPYERNAKRHDPEQVAKIAASIREFGFLTPVLIDERRNIIAGHGRVMAAREIGMESVPCVTAEGLTDAERRAYIIADNRLTELGEWDFDLVELELEELKALDFDISITGFDISTEPLTLDAEEETDETVTCRFTFDDYASYSEYETELRDIAERAECGFSIK